MKSICDNRLHLGIELGSTRIKAVLINDRFEQIAAGAFEWENSLVDGYWSYSLDEVHRGVRDCFADLCRSFNEKYGKPLTCVASVGVSAMMHGYLAFDKDGNLLAPFRTWRNTTTERAADALSELFSFNIPQRWSIAHLYQAILNGEEHVGKIAHITTLAGYVHYLLTGRRELGLCDASGMFPIKNGDYDKELLDKFRELIKPCAYAWDIAQILPSVRPAGYAEATLTEDGARFLSPDAPLPAGIPVCPPEGDGATGMVATNSVLQRRGNVSAGTSVFAMLVLDEPMKTMKREIDIVATPTGAPVAMIHCNNCSSELDTWVSVFGEVLALSGKGVKKGELYEMLYNHALTAPADCAGVTAYNYLSGEHVTNVPNGRPMIFSLPENRLTLASLMRAELYSAVATLRIGADIIFADGGAKAEGFTAHGGLFKTEGVAQQILADALNTPITVMKTAAEGGAYGMALLACYMLSSDGKSLEEWLTKDVFASVDSKTLAPTEAGKAGFEKYMERYKAGLCAERALAEVK